MCQSISLEPTDASDPPEAAGPTPAPKRVAVIGAGAAGMAAAWSLSRFPDKWDVTMIEAAAEPGGVACTLEHEGQRVNYGVQGGTPASHQNTIALMREFGVSVGDCRLDVSFGKGEHNWKNYEAKPTGMQRRLRDETARFGRVLRWISWFEWLSIFVSIEWILRICRFSAEFRQRMVYPLVALFFGTGNQTAEVSAAVVARVFLDKSLALFEYDPERLVSQSPTNIAFRDLAGFYRTMQTSMEGERCHFLFSTRATRLRRSSAGAELDLEDAPRSWRAGSDQSGDERARLVPRRARTLHFDEVIFACAANVASTILGEGASWLERKVLRNVEYFRDLTVTHTDEAYMRRHNEVDERAVYFIKSYEDDPSRVEMGFDLTAYQPELRERHDGGTRIYQTIFLDESRSKTWSLGEITPSKVIDRAWWVCFSHSYRHFRRVVPWVWALQGRQHTWFAGSWTLFNTHDIAIASGLAAAHRLGAPYPFAHLPLAAATFDTVLGTSHMRWRRGGAASPPAAGTKSQVKKRD